MEERFWCPVCERPALADGFHNCNTCEDCDSEMGPDRPETDEGCCVFCWIERHRDPEAFKDFEVSIGTPDGWKVIRA